MSILNNFKLYDTFNRHAPLECVGFFSIHFQVEYSTYSGCSSTLGMGKNLLIAQIAMSDIGITA